MTDMNCQTCGAALSHPNNGLCDACNASGCASCASCAKLRQERDFFKREAEKLIEAIKAAADGTLQPDGTIKEAGE